MTPRQSLAYILLGDALRNNHKDKESFRRSAIATLDCIENPRLAAEVDRLDNISLGIGRLISQVWNQYMREN